MRADALPELNHGDEAVPIIAIPALRPRLLLGAQRRERAVAALRERHRQARRSVAVRRIDGRGDALNAVDLAPWHLPPAEVAVEASDRGRECAQLLLRRSVPG